MIPEKTTSIEQRAFLLGSQRFEIRPDGDLEVTLHRFHVHNQFKVPLWSLNPAPTRMKYMQVGSLVGMIIFGLGAAAIVISWLIYGRHDLGLAGAFSFPVLFFVCFSIACLWRWRTKSVNAVIYHIRNSDGRLFLWHDNPKPGVFKDFCETLTNKAQEAWNSRPVDPNAQSLPGELAALKKLKDTGVLNDAEFERAKAKLLEQAEEKRRIGFK